MSQDEYEIREMEWEEGDDIPVAFNCPRCHFWIDTRIQDVVEIATVGLMLTKYPHVTCPKCKGCCGCFDD